MLTSLIMRGSANYAEFIVIIESNFFCGVANMPDTIMQTYNA